MYLADARQVTEAADLIAAFGAHAEGEATQRANRYRDIGNHIRFCRWRQTTRLIALLGDTAVAGTVH